MRLWRTCSENDTLALVCEPPEAGEMVKRKCSRCPAERTKLYACTGCRSKLCHGCAVRCVDEEVWCVPCHDATCERLRKPTPGYDN